MSVIRSAQVQLCCIFSLIQTAIPLLWDHSGEWFSGIRTFLSQWSCGWLNAGCVVMYFEMLLDLKKKHLTREIHPPIYERYEPRIFRLAHIVILAGREYEYVVSSGFPTFEDMSGVLHKDQTFSACAERQQIKKNLFHLSSSVSFTFLQKETRVFCFGWASAALWSMSVFFSQDAWLIFGHDPKCCGCWTGMWTIFSK